MQKRIEKHWNARFPIQIKKFRDLRASISTITKECDSATAELKLKKDEDDALRRLDWTIWRNSKGNTPDYCDDLEMQKQLKDEEAAILVQLRMQRNLKKALETDKGKPRRIG